MVHRQTAGGLISITQPMHSWVSGQLARHWGNEQFGYFLPLEEVCLAAEQHDIGFIAWERSPTLNPATALPHDFRQMPTPVHLAIWTQTVDHTMAFNRYSTLLVCLHVAGLCQRHHPPSSPSEAKLINDFLSQQHTLQSKLQSELSSDPLYQPHATDSAIERNRSLVSTWDWISLLLCLVTPGQHSVENVPTATGSVHLTLDLPADNPNQATLTPWPFRTSSVHLSCEGRPLTKTFTDQTAMRDCLNATLPISIPICLNPITN